MLGNVHVTVPWDSSSGDLLEGDREISWGEFSHFCSPHETPSGVTIVADLEHASYLPRIRCDSAIWAPPNLKPIQETYGLLRMHGLIPQRQEQIVRTIVVSIRDIF